VKHDHEYLSKLYVEDPEEFKRVTAAMINEAIDGTRAENREILRAKQWRLEQELNKIHDPVERMNRMVSMFWAGVNEFVEVTKSFGFTNDLTAKKPAEKSKPCQVVEFKKKLED